MVEFRSLGRELEGKLGGKGDQGSFLINLCLEAVVNISSNMTMMGKHMEIKEVTCQVT
jgi:hypothetical protein